MNRRIAEAAERRAHAIAVRAADAITANAPGVQVARDGLRLTLSGRGLARRALHDPALRWIGGLLR